MSNYQPYEPILNKNLQELRIGNKNINHLKKIKVFDSDTLAEKLQQTYRYDPDFAIESLKFSYNGFHGRSKYVQDLWQTELRLYKNSQFAQKPAYKSFYCPTIYDCYLDTPHEYFAGQHIDDLVETLISVNYDAKVPYLEMLACVKEDIQKAFVNSVTSSISHLLLDPINNGKIVVLSLLPIRYDEDCPSYFSAIQQDIPLMNKKIQDYCNRRNVQFVNIFPYFADSEGFLRTDLSDDGIFLNENGDNLLSSIVTHEIQRQDISQSGQSTPFQ